MYKVDINYIQGRQVFSLHGKIDTTNAEEISLLVIPKIDPSYQTILDFEDVDYISSVGLRFVLKVSKLNRHMAVINVKKEVYDVFQMTGFTEMIQVYKELRTISIEGKNLIGEGYMGKVYRLDHETIVKVYVRNSGLEDVVRESDLARKAFVFGIPTAIPFDAVKIKEGGYGNVFELIDSQSLNKLIAANPENAEKYRVLYLDLLKTMMNTEVPADDIFPPCKSFAREWASDLRKRQAFEPAVMDKIDVLIETIPDVNRFVHGDYHIKNVMVQNDEAMLIDMDTVGRGHPIFEFTAFYLTYIGYPSTEPGDCNRFLGVDDEFCVDLFNRAVKECFPNRTDKEYEEIIEKCSLLGYIWLTEKTLFFEKENVKRLTHSQEQVLKLIDKYQSLAF